MGVVPLGDADAETRQPASEPRPRGLQIFVRTFDRTVCLNVLASDHVERVKTLVQQKVGIPPAYQRLVFAGKELEDDRLLSDYHIHQDSQLMLLGRLKGGMSQK